MNPPRRHLWSSGCSPCWSCSSSADRSAGAGRDGRQAATPRRRPSRAPTTGHAGRGRGRGRADRVADEPEPEAARPRSSRRSRRSDASRSSRAEQPAGASRPDRRESAPRALSSRAEVVAASRSARARRGRVRAASATSSGVAAGAGDARRGAGRDAEVAETPDQAELRALREQLRALEQVVQQQAADHPTAALARVEETAAEQSAAYLRQVSFVVRGLAAHTSEDEDPRRTLARVAAAVERLGVPNQMERPILPVTNELPSRSTPDARRPSHRADAAEQEGRAQSDRRTRRTPRVRRPAEPSIPSRSHRARVPSRRPLPVAAVPSYAELEAAARYEDTGWRCRSAVVPEPGESRPAGRVRAGGERHPRLPGVGDGAARAAAGRAPSRPADAACRASPAESQRTRHMTTVTEDPRSAATSPSA